MPHQLTPLGRKRIERSGADYLFNNDTIKKSVKEEYDDRPYCHHFENYKQLEDVIEGVVEDVFYNIASQRPEEMLATFPGELEKFVNLQNYCYWHNVSERSLRQSIVIYLREILIKEWGWGNKDPRTEEEKEEAINQWD